LLVEDSPTNMKLAVHILKQTGEYEVLEAVRADIGITLAREHMPELIFMDINMSGMDGLTATRLLKSDEKTRNIKIVALTALAMNGDKERAIEAGCDGYLSKPIRYKELLELVETFNQEGHCK